MAKTILLIDDDENMHIHMRVVLETAGYQLISAYSSDEGLDKLLLQLPDLVILDYLMPQKTGDQTFVELKSSARFEKHRDIPVIMLTAASQSKERIELLLRKGLNAYLEKPFGNKELLNVIENTLVTNAISIRNLALRKAVENSKNFLENLVESCPVAIFTCDREGRITFASKAIEDILGYSTTEVVGRSICNFLRIGKNDLEELLVNTKVSSQVTRGLYLRAKSGSEIPMGITYSHLHDKNDRIQGLLIVGQDLSDQKRLEKELLEKERLAAIAESVATINHQINNPLTPILGNIQLIRKEENLLTDDHIRKLDIIETNVRKISDIVQKFNCITNPERKTYYGDARIFQI